MKDYLPVERLNPGWLSDKDFATAVLGCIGFPALVNDAPELRSYLAMNANTTLGAACINGYSPAFGEPPSYFTVD